MAGLLDGILSLGGAGSLLGAASSGAGMANTADASQFASALCGAGGGLPSGDLLGSVGGLANGLLGGILGGGGSGQAAGGLGGCIGGLLGGVASGVHQTAENLISATGLGDAFAPIDAAIVHPLLWDPLSSLTGTDVSKHPAGVADVTDPLGVRS